MATTIETKRIPVISADVQGTKLILDFSNGEQLIVNAAGLSDQIRSDAIMHGLKQKLVDAAAIARNPDTGKSATIADKFNAVKDIFDRITSENGTWNKVRGDGSGNGSSGLLVRALMQLNSNTRVEIETWLEPKTKEQKAALRINPKVAAIITAIQSANSAIDSDELLDDLS